MYEQGSFEPVARVVQLSEVLEKQRIDNAVTHVWQYVPSGIVTQDVLDNVEKAKQPLVKIYHYHNNHLGTPQELSDESGNIIWLSYDRAWGGSFETIYKPQFIDNFAISENELQPIKFQGQSLDTETGLHYNRFRYYDSDVGMFISRDPIGLMGGSNVFQYAPNPIEWIDPWGLKGCTVTQGDGKTHDIVLTLDKSEYKDTFGHIEDYITGKIPGKKANDIFTIDRDMASAQRAKSLDGVPTKKGFDRDEFPMAMFKEGGTGASIRYITPSDNRGAGSSIGKALTDYPNGTRVKIVVQ